ncbi:MAG: hypothetical protein IJJ19_06240 [Erysipelotrichaceae bacterium]|nr:hypothetical protein [Erysipelotrichaceae bacterium]
MRKIIALMMCLLLLMAGCSKDTEINDNPTETESESESVQEVKEMKMMINDTYVEVSWEDNKSVEALKEMCKNGNVTVEMSMYGGFEQVGYLGKSLPSNDRQTTTASGDIVLYSSDNIVVFYGSNSWSYTRLGHITDKNESEMKELLGNGDVTLTLVLE